MGSNHGVPLFASRARAFRTSFGHGFVDSKHIVQWADQQVEDLEDPPIALLDLSMSLHDLNLQISALNRLSTGFEPRRVHAWICRDARRALLDGRTTVEAVTQAIYTHMAVEHWQFSDDLRMRVYDLDDYLEWQHTGAAHPSGMSPGELLLTLLDDIEREAVST
ncbi:MAG: hypothetical protein ACON5B_02725 [Myxococcota bacterium]